MMIYFTAATSLTVAAELGVKHSESVEKDKQEQALDPEQVEKLREQRQYLEKEIGPHVLNYLWQRHLEEQSREPKELQINGADKAEVDQAVLKALWSEGDSYPAGWIGDDVDQIDIKNFSDIEGPVYKKEGQQIAGQANDKNSMQLGVIDGLSKEDQLKTLDWHFGHESGHLNDWSEDHSARFNERVDLLARVHQRLNAPDRFEDITGSDYGNMEKIEDESKRQFYLAKEYWAMICEHYFTFPEILKEESPKDFALVDDWVKRQDPNFDPFAAAEHRKQIIQSHF